MATNAKAKARRRKSNAAPDVGHVETIGVLRSCELRLGAIRQLLEFAYGPSGKTHPMYPEAPDCKTLGDAISEAFQSAGLPEIYLDPVPSPMLRHGECPLVEGGTITVNGCDLPALTVDATAFVPHNRLERLWTELVEGKRPVAEVHTEATDTRALLQRYFFAAWKAFAKWGFPNLARGRKSVDAGRYGERAHRNYPEFISLVLPIYDALQEAHPDWSETKIAKNVAKLPQVVQQRKAGHYATQLGHVTRAVIYAVRNRCGADGD